MYLRLFAPALRCSHTRRCIPFRQRFLTAPFYLASQLVAVRGGFDHYHSGAVGSNVASTQPCGHALPRMAHLARARSATGAGRASAHALRFAAFVLRGALNPSYKHAADALYSTAAFWFAFRSSRTVDAATTRLHRIGYLPGDYCSSLATPTGPRDGRGRDVLGSPAWRARRGWSQLRHGIESSCCLGLPVIRHIPYGSPPASVRGWVGERCPGCDLRPRLRVAMGPGVISARPARRVRISPTAPLKMLFTLHRGIVLWTPLTCFATVGFVAFLLRRDRRTTAFSSRLVCPPSRCSRFTLLGSALGRWRLILAALFDRALPLLSGWDRGVRPAVR